MQFLQVAANFIFITACAISIAAWFLVVLETIFLFRLSGALYRFGRVVFSENREFSHAEFSLPPSQTIKLNSCQFRLAGGNRWIFGPRFRLFSLSLSHNVPIKGTVSWAGPHAAIETRIPIGTSLAFAAWVVGWTTLGIAMLLLPDVNRLEPTIFIFWGWIVAAGIYFLILRLSRHASKIYVAEILQYLKDQ